MPNYETLIYDKADNGVVTITLNRPDRMNTLGGTMKPDLYDAFQNVMLNDRDVRCVIITGAGERAFCAGMDLKHRAREAGADEAQRQAWAEMQNKARPLNTRWHFPKPVIAKVNGFALGGGLELALSCDIIVAAEHAEVGLPEPSRGLIAGGVGVHRLPRQMGLKPAMGYLLTGRHMSAQRAYELGLVNEVVPKAALDECDDGWVADILRCAPLAVRATKEAVMKGLDTTLSDAFLNPYKAETIRANSQDAVEGPRAFAEKRTPEWQGR